MIFAQTMRFTHYWSEGRSSYSGQNYNQTYSRMVTQHSKLIRAAYLLHSGALRSEHWYAKDEAPQIAETMFGGYIVVDANLNALKPTTWDKKEMLDVSECLREWRDMKIRNVHAGYQWGKYVYDWASLGPKI